jgi:broad specificity phosphatase PhoE
MRRRTYLMRHAEAGYFERRSAPVDPAQVALTDLGLEQARAAGRALRDVRFDRVVTSGLPRTIRTAELVVEQLAHAPADSVFRSDPDLQELRPGDLDAVRDEDLEASFLAAWRGTPPFDAAFLGGETVGSLIDRVGRAMERIHADDGWDTLLLVAHGGTNRAILSAALAGRAAFFGHLEQSPGCINVVDGGGADFVVRAVNVTPYDLVHDGPRTTTLERMLEQFREYRRQTQRR